MDKRRAEGVSHPPQGEDDCTPSKKDSLSFLISLSSLFFAASAATNAGLSFAAIAATISTSVVADIAVGVGGVPPSHCRTERGVITAVDDGGGRPSH